MAFHKYQGNFLLRSGTGSQTVSFIPPTTFTPKLVKVWSTAVAADGVAANAKFDIGAATASAQFAMATTGTNGSTGTTQHHQYQTNAALGVAITTAGAVFTSFSLTSFGSNQFTINVTVGSTFQRIWHYEVYGGSDLTNVAILQAQCPGSDDPQSVTGAGFTPTYAQFFSQDNIGTPPDFDSASHVPRFTMGHTDGTTHAAMGGRMTATTYAKSRWSESAVLALVDNSGNAIQTAAFDSWNSDGVNIEWTDTTGDQSYFWVILFRGGSYKVGNFTSSATATTQDLTVTVSGAPFYPAGFSLMSAGQSSTGIVDGREKFAYGGASSTSALGAIGSSANNANPSVEYNTHETDHCLSILLDNSVDASCTVDAIATGKITLNWDVAKALRCSFVAMGDAVTTVTSDAAAPLEWRADLTLDSLVPLEWLLDVRNAAELPLDWWDTSVVSPAEIPIEWIGNPIGDAELPLAWLGLDEITSSPELPIEWSSPMEPLDSELPLAWLESPAGDAELPLDWAGLLAVSLSPALPVEWIASIGLSSVLPVEWRGPATISRDVVLPLEWKLDVEKQAGTVIDWRAILHVDAAAPLAWKGSTAGEPAAPLEWLGGLYSSKIIPLSWRSELVLDRMLPVAWVETIAPYDAQFPLAWAQGVSGAGVLPLEWSGGAGVALNVMLPLEWRLDLAGSSIVPLAWQQAIAGDAELPAEWRGSLNPASAFALAWQGSTRADRVLPLEWRAEVLRDVELPLAWQQVIASAFDLPLEWPEGVSRLDVLPLEWSGGAGVALSVVLPVDWRGEIAGDAGIGLEWKGNTAGDGELAVDWLAIPDGSAPLGVEWRGEILTFAVFPMEWLEGVTLSEVFCEMPFTWQQGAANAPDLPMEWRAEDVPDVAGGIWVLGPRGSVWRLPARSSLAILPPRGTIREV